MTITTDREWIAEAVRNDKPTLIDGIKGLYNCREADADEDGDVYIEGPQSGHWLSADDLGRVAREIKSGHI